MVLLSTPFSLTIRVVILTTFIFVFILCIYTLSLTRPAFKTDIFLTDKLQRLHTVDNAQKTNSSKETSGAKMTNIAVMAIPLALYIHIPWCVKKCPYCDF